MKKPYSIIIDYNNFKIFAENISVERFLNYVVVSIMHKFNQPIGRIEVYDGNSKLDEADKNIFSEIRMFANANQMQVAFESRTIKSTGGILAESAVDSAIMNKLLYERCVLIASDADFMDSFNSNIETIFVKLPNTSFAISEKVKNFNISTVELPVGYITAFHKKPIETTISGYTSPHIYFKIPESIREDGKKSGIALLRTKCKLFHGVSDAHLEEFKNSEQMYRIEIGYSISTLGSLKITEFNVDKISKIS